jgi:phage shock protein C
MEQIYNQSSAKRLTRSAKDRVFGGICGGLASYLDIDPVLVRVLYVGLTLISGGAFGVILYLIAWIIIPLDTGLAQAQLLTPGHRMSGRRMLGVLLIVVGAVILLASVLPFSWYFSEAQIIGPVILIAAGITLIMWKRDADSKRIEYAYAPPVQTESESYMSGSTTNYAPGDSSASTPRRMYRIEKDRKIAGICSGLGEYFNMDPTIIRIFWVMLLLLVGTGLLLYLIMWFVMPLKAESIPSTSGEVKT